MRGDGGFVFGRPPVLGWCSTVRGDFGRCSTGFVSLGCKSADIMSVSVIVCKLAAAIGNDDEVMGTRVEMGRRFCAS